jgi:pimeloyl-ACP methyl ester carboxylesterase
MGNPLPGSRFTFSDGVTVSLVDVGSGPALFLIPGADGMKETFRHQLVDLSRAYRVLAPDLRDGVTPDVGFDRLAIDVDEILRDRGIDRAVILGQSLGGSIAMRFAVRYPTRVRGLVVVNSLARVDYDHVGLNRYMLIPVAMATTRYLPTALARMMARLWCRLNVWVFDSSAGQDRLIEYALTTGGRAVDPQESGARVDLFRQEDLRPELRSIVAPTLVLKGSLDRYTLASWSREIAELIPRGQYLEIAGTGHCSHISMPDVFNRTLLDWLSELDRREGQEEDKA